MNTENLVNTNNKLRQRLNIENLKYYEDILLYIRAGAILKKEIESEEVLIELLNDLLEAQNNGLSAIDYFGKNPKKMSDDIIENINKNSLKEMLSLLSLGFVSYFIFSFFSNIIRPDEGVDIGKTLVLSVVPFIFILILAKGMNIFSFSKNNTKVIYILSVSIFLYIISIILLTGCIPEIYTIYLKGSIGIVVTLLASITLFIYNQKDKTINYNPIIISTLILSILTRLSSTEAYFKTITGESIIYFVFIISVALCFFMNDIKEKFKNLINKYSTN